ncbi:unnamed protein product (macronuclear) [Paramecium tetraurelia]|uniref:histone deacetylase n=1 Tax=Paramecium tetraurelia TaxID=5888 RepID=A0DIS2_PARTE|nr:uncharacterized protein GSPATT00017296001 [Paramecium tetraurelia]CAK82939.1 unnamed protein product [Paramecium tetraurelia]|eukprot:XP_001450336.1 hypothetical protein (macronuclear) [Paramecium tetraurelia strain d4-2]
MQQIQEEFSKLTIETYITGFIHCEEFDNHFSAKEHCENPQRTQSIDKTIQNYLSSKDLKNKVEQLSQFEQCDINHLRLVHDEKYIDFVEGLFNAVGNEQLTKDVKYFDDTYLCKTSAVTARKCVQAVLEGVDKILKAEWRNGFCSVRPPGHHSGHKNKPNGFCVYNNVAVAAKYARAKYNVNKIVIFDWDVHHCDGTESIFYEDPNTLVISIHRYDGGSFYPGSGDPVKIGRKDAEYKNINVGWNVGWNVKDNDAPGYDDYVYAYDRLLGPIIKEFGPDFIIISAGYDSAKGDPLGGINNTPQGYQYMTEKLQQLCPRVLAVLEGGYNLDITAQCALATFEQLLGVPKQFPAIIQPGQCGINAVQTTVDKHKQFWTCLSSKELLEYQKQFLGETVNLISGGHLQAFQIKDNIIIKTTKKQEYQFYSTLTNLNNPYYDENKRLIKFLPKLISLDEKACTISMENLTYGLENGSILDLKIGYKTYHPNCTQEKKEKEIKKASLCDQVLMGFRAAGIKIRDQNGVLTINKNGSEAYNWITNDQKMKDIIEQVFKSNQVEQPNREALQGCINFIQELIEALQTSKRLFRSTSILIIVDNISKKYQIKWIDFNYVMNLSDDSENPEAEMDNNIMGGLKYLMSILKSIEEK